MATLRARNRKPARGQRTLTGTVPRRFERFLAFHRDNPQVYAWFKFFARQMWLKNKRGSARLIGERIRWEVAVPIRRAAVEGAPSRLRQDVKFNDHYWPYYARVLMASDVRFKEFFETRDTKFDIDTETLLREFRRIGEQI